MKGKTRSIERIVEEHVQKWQMSRKERIEKETVLPVITISREPGCGGRVLAQELAGRHDLDLFHQEVLHAMAASAKVSAQFLATLDEKGLSVLQETISSLVHERHLWPDQYLQHLMKVIGTIGKHGEAAENSGHQDAKDEDRQQDLDEGEAKLGGSRPVTGLGVEPRSVYRHKAGRHSACATMAGGRGYGWEGFRHCYQNGRSAGRRTHPAGHG